MDCVHSVREILALGKSVLIAFQGISFGFLCGFVAAGSFEIDLESRSFFGSLDLSLAVVGMLDDRDIAFDDTLRHVDGRGVVQLD